MGAFTPLSANELCAAVRNGAAYDASRLDRILRVDASSGLVEVQAQASWRALAEALRPGDAHAQQLAALRASVGQSIAWNAAGPDGRPCVGHVESLTLVTSEGHLRRISRSSQAELFALAIGGQGAFGALYSATLRIESLTRAVSEAQAPAASRASRRRALHLLLPPRALEPCLHEVRERCVDWRMTLEDVHVRGIRQENETFLRWARCEYAALALLIGERWTLGGSVRSTQLRRELIDVAIAHGGSFPIACTPEATREQTLACYPELAHFLAEQRRLDPHERWSNPWLRHQRDLLNRQPCELRWSS